MIVSAKHGWWSRFTGGAFTGEGDDRKRVNGVRAAIQAIREQMTPENLGVNVAQMASQQWAGFFDAITFGAQSASDAFRQMATSMLRSLAQLANQRLFLELLGAIGLGGAGGGGAGGGGRGGTPAPTAGIP